MAWSTNDWSYSGGTITRTEQIGSTDFEITARFNGLRVSYVTITATPHSGSTESKTAAATETALNSLISALQTLVTNNAGNTSGTAF